MRKAMGQPVQRLLTTTENVWGVGYERKGLLAATMRLLLFQVYIRSI